MIRLRASHKLEEVLFFSTAVVKGGITDTDIFHHNPFHKRNHPFLSTGKREKGKRKKEKGNRHCNFLVDPISISLINHNHNSGAYDMPDANN
jgi:hypothetical protein